MAEVKTVAVIGVHGSTGLGWAIAQAMARSGYRTILEDLFPDRLRAAENEVRAAFARAIAEGTVSRAEADSALSRLEFAGTIEEAARLADLVIEAVPDEMESKIEIFVLLDRFSKPRTILASTTSSLSLSEVASITCRANKILGMRFPHMPAGVKTLELVRTPQTDDETIAACAEIGRRMGWKVVVRAEESLESP